MNTEESIKTNLQQRIVNTLLLNASFIDNLGLMHGKMGISIFFFHLARKTNNKIYEDYAGELIDEIYEEISVNTPIDFENGLAGIGWGIEYLIQNGFIEADTDEVLEEFDDSIIHELTNNTPDTIDILNGLCGYILYFQSRLKSCKNNKVANSKLLLNTIVLLEQNINDRYITADAKQFWKESNKFDVTWEFASLLWILAILAENGISRKKVNEYIYNILISVQNNDSFPQLQTNCLLLTLAFEKLKQSKIEQHSLNLLYKLKQKLLTNLVRGIILSELKYDSSFLRHGTLGISWIYKQLFELTNEKQFKQEMEYWTNLSYSREGADNGFAGFDFKNDGNVFGLLAGLAGFGLF